MAQRFTRAGITVVQVAEALQVSTRTVQRMVEADELEVPLKGWRFEIPLESLQKWIFRTLGMYGAARICKQAERNEEISLKKSRQIPRLARSYIQRNTPISGDSQAQNELEPVEALERLKPLMRRLALRFGGKDAHLREDLYQEMAVAILECEGRKSVAYYADRIEWRAVDYLRKELERGMVYEPRLRLEECVKTVAKVDCSKVVKLFNLARLPLCMLEMFGVWLEEDEVRGNEGDGQRVA